jgi:hypothetical protein
MKRILGISLGALVALFVGIFPANAQTHFTLTGTNTSGSDPLSVDLTLTATPDTAGNTAHGGSLAAPIYDVTAISGTVTDNGHVITVSGIVPQTNVGTETTLHPAPDSPNGSDLIWDSLLSATAPNLDGDGIAFTLSNGDYINIWGQPSGTYYDFGDNFSEGLALSLSGGQGLGATPEPGSMLLFGTGLLGIAFVMRKKARSIEL